MNHDNTLANMTVGDLVLLLVVVSFVVVPTMAGVIHSFVNRRSSDD